jgi:hypothetical protein
MMEQTNLDMEEGLKIGAVAVEGEFTFYQGRTGL